jgi:hypothetical protein
MDNIDFAIDLRFHVGMETTPTTPAAAVPPSPVKKASLTKVLPSDRLTFDRQTIALKAFVAEYEANGGKPVSNEKAGQICKMAAATIVVTNAFFTDTGLLIRSEEGFAPSAEAVSYLKAVHGLSPESAPEKLRPLFEKQWFSQAVIPRLQLGPKDQSDVIKILGEESSAGKEHIPRLNILIEFMAFVGVIKKDGNQISLPSGTTPPPPSNGGGGQQGGGQPTVPQGYKELVIPLDARSGRKAILHFPDQFEEPDVKKLISFVELSFDIQK